MPFAIASLERRFGSGLIRAARPRWQTYPPTVGVRNAQFIQKAHFLTTANESLCAHLTCDGYMSASPRSSLNVQIYTPETGVCAFHI